jgi:hypothetical protein
MLRATFKCLNQRQAFDAPPAPLPHSRLVKGDEDCGPMIFSRQPRSHDTQHARMPVPRAEDDRRIARRIKMIDEFLFRLLTNFSFDHLAIAVLGVE